MPAADLIRIEPTDPQGVRAMWLLREAAIEARLLYPELQAADSPWPTNPPLGVRDTYLIAFLGNSLAGCGALRSLDEQVVELRRMYVLPEARRLGVARALLVRLEQAAHGLGFRLLRLETGHRQQPAMAFYEASGFRRIAPFGAYADDPTSVCYEKVVPC